MENIINAIVIPTRVIVIYLTVALSMSSVLGEGNVSAKGLVIRNQGPGSSNDLAYATEYSEIEKFAHVTNLTPATGGNKIRLSNDQVVEVVEYFDFSTASITSDQQIADLKARPAALGVLARKYPNAHRLLAEEATRLQSAIQMLEQGKVLIGGQWKDKDAMATSSAPEKLSITVHLDGGQARTYTGVTVTGQEPDSLQIMHSGGAATIPFEQLTADDQKKYGFDPVKAAEYRKQKEMAIASQPPSPQQTSGTTGASGTNKVTSINGDSTPEDVVSYMGEPEKEFVNKLGMPAFKFQKGTMEITTSFQEGLLRIIQLQSTSLKDDGAGFEQVKLFLREPKPVYSDGSDDGTKILIEYQSPDGEAQHLIEPIKQRGTVTVTFD
ncbi:MAG: hypothetical protein CMO55_23355 [Verrucomicrobiales bacterium]|nr:hypothetical protein [Verrucomicrobiales bacterium]